MLQRASFPPLCTPRVMKITSIPFTTLSVVTYSKYSSSSSRIRRPPTRCSRTMRMATIRLPRRNVLASPGGSDYVVGSVNTYPSVRTMPTSQRSTRNHSRGSIVHVAFVSKNGMWPHVTTSLPQSVPSLILSSERRAVVVVRTIGLRVQNGWGSVPPRIIRVSSSVLMLGTRYSLLLYTMAESPFTDFIRKKQEHT